MKKLKLTAKMPYLICGILQFLIGIIYFICSKRNISFLIIFIFLGIALILIPYLKLPKIKSKKSDKVDKVIGILLICISILMLLLVPNDLIFLLFLDSGLLNLII
ncbi:hypothetical protein DS835_06970 [Lactobacillus bombicola]|uniref:Uncharacterized protein n=1 Tax=Lactobacillus bombicola TaxID=1505723 RepID=A0A396SPB5_9LACO|nr:hypothetical protein DS835_06970 [Lactobacillus bombicola]